MMRYATVEPISRKADIDDLLERSEQVLKSVNPRVKNPRIMKRTF